MLCSNSLQRWVPNKLMNLQPKPRWHIVGQHPFGQFTRIEQAVRRVAAATGVLGERRRKNHGTYPCPKSMFRGESSGELVIHPIANHKFNLVARSERVQVFQAKAVG